MLNQPQPPQRPRIVICEWMDAPAIERLRAVCDVSYQPDLGVQRSALLDAVGGAQALIVRNRTQVDAQLLQAAQTLRVVGRLGVGLDNIDLSTCDARQVKVIPAVGTNARSVAEYVLMAALLLVRGVAHATPSVANGQWPREAFMQGREIAGRTLGVVGWGSIGRLVAQLAVRTGMKVKYFSRSTDASTPDEGAMRVDSLHKLLTQSDVVSLHVPLTTATRGLLGPKELALMRRDAVLINTARGGVVDEIALAQALRKGRLGGAAIDVFENEPLSADNAWKDCPNVLLTPHIAGLTVESNRRVSDFIADRVLEALA